MMTKQELVQAGRAALTRGNLVAARRYVEQAKGVHSDNYHAELGKSLRGSQVLPSSLTLAPLEYLAKQFVYDGIEIKVAKAGTRHAAWRRRDGAIYLDPWLFGNGRTHLLDAFLKAIAAPALRLAADDSELTYDPVYSSSKANCDAALAFYEAECARWASDNRGYALSWLQSCYDTSDPYQACAGN